MVRVSRQTKNLIYRILTIILAMALAAGAIFGIYKIVEKSKEKTKTIRPTYSVGALDSNGEYIKSENSLYTKDAFECQGLNIELDFDNSISYEVFFYDSTGKFISSSGKQVSVYKDVPMLAARARIVITPNPTEDGAVTVTWYNKYKYSKQMTVIVNKTQKAKTITIVDNKLIVKDEDKSGVGNMLTGYDTFVPNKASHTTDFMISKPIALSGAKEIVFVFNSKCVLSLAFGDKNSATIGDVIPFGSEQITTFSFSVPTGAEFVRFNTTTGVFEKGVTIYLINNCL